MELKLPTQLSSANFVAQETPPSSQRLQRTTTTTTLHHSNPSRTAKAYLHRPRAVWECRTPSTIRGDAPLVQLEARRSTQEVSASRYLSKEVGRAHHPHRPSALPCAKHASSVAHREHTLIRRTSRWVGNAWCSHHRVVRRSSRVSYPSLWHVDISYAWWW